MCQVVGGKREELQPPREQVARRAAGADGVRGGGRDEAGGVPAQGRSGGTKAAEQPQSIHREAGGHPRDVRTSGRPESGQGFLGICITDES